MSFAASIQKNSNKLLDEVNANCYKIVKELFRLTVKLSPSPSNPGEYAQGFLADQWYVEDGKDFSEELSSSTSPSGASSLARVEATSGKEFYKTDGAMTFTNNVSYAYRAEAIGWPAEDGWSGRVGPYRMVARALQTISARYS